MSIEFLDDLLHKFPPPSMLYILNSVCILKRMKKQENWCKIWLKMFFSKLAPERWLKILFLERNSSFPSFFSLFAQKNIERANFDQHLECAAPKRLSKYTTPKCSFFLIKASLNLNYVLIKRGTKMSM